MTATIAISNQKGGVAKTTTCLSLGACLAERGRSVLLVDMDPQAHLTLSLGLQPQRMRHTAADVLMGSATLASVSRETEIFGLDLVPANRTLNVVDHVLYGRPHYEFHLRNMLGQMKRGMYDVVLLDCPPSVGALTLNALTAADLLITPVQCEYYAMLSLRRMMDLVRLLRDKVNPGLQYRVLATLYDQNNGICRVILEQMQQDLSQILFTTIIEDDAELRECSAFGKPITMYAPHGRGTAQYRSLAAEVMNHG